jgi:oxalate---CoA ligase
VAIVLPNGPEMAAAFLAIGCGASTAPLNPAYRAEEFTFYMTDLRAKALVILHGMASDAREVAGRLSIPVLDLIPGEAAGAFTLEGGEPGNAEKPGMAWPEDEALVLHTSGTTARPKIVPLTQANICASARNIGRTLRTGAGRCLPQHHAAVPHPRADRRGAGVMAREARWSARRASTRCASSAGWMRSARSWFTAVPTMHQAILGRAERNADIIKRARLRFLRSSSASLPGPVMQQMEQVFGCPLVESYGMTEASHQMCSNPLAGPRKPGSVGLAGGARGRRHGR